MKLRSSILACVFASCLAACAFSAARAQDAPDTVRATWGIIAAGDGITGAYRGTLVSGLAGGVLAQFPLPSRHLSLRADLVYHWVGTNGGDMVDILGGASGSGRCTGGFVCSVEGSWSRIVATSISVVARLNEPSTRWSPYVIGGVAGYLTGNSDEPLYQFHPNHLGFQGGVGFEVRPNRHSYFLEVRYVGVPPGGLVPITIGMRF
jgi:opacity protein-like surface antigen